MALIAIVVLCACTIEQELILGHEYSGVWTLEGRPMSFAGDALEDLAILGGYDNLDEFYDEIISQTISNLKARSDIENFEVERIGKYALMANVEFSDIRVLFGDAAFGGIADVAQNGETHTISLRFNHERAAELEELFPIIKETAFSIFNPAANEGFSEEEYINEILGFTFGEENLPELRQAMVNLAITVPGTIVKVEGGAKSSENSARFETPFTRLLVPEKEIVWLVNWKNQDPMHRPSTAKKLQNSP